MIGTRLKQLRSEKNLRQIDLAELLNVSKSAIAMYESDSRDPDTETLSFLAEYFNVSVDYLLGRSNMRKNESETISFNTVSVDGLDEDEIAAVKNMIEMLKKNK